MDLVSRYCNIKVVFSLFLYLEYLYFILTHSVLTQIKIGEYTIM